MAEWLSGWGDNFRHCAFNLRFYNVLPANVCDMISEYNVYCNQCCITRDFEKFFVEEHKNKGYTKNSDATEIL